MDRRTKRLGMVALLGTALLLAALASMASNTWATPEQRVRANDDTIPDKTCDDDWVARGESTQIEILVNNPASALDTWYDTVVTDTVDSNLRIAGVWASQGYASWTDGEATFDIGTMPPGTEATLRLYIWVDEDATPCYDVYNTAYLTHVGWGPVSSGSTWMFRIACEQYMPLSMKGY
jgi:hypothetical protein